MTGIIEDYMRTIRKRLPSSPSVTKAALLRVQDSIRTARRILQHTRAARPWHDRLYLVGAALSEIARAEKRLLYAYRHKSGDTFCQPITDSNLSGGSSQSGPWEDFSHG